MRVPFVKMEGLGNDYVFVDAIRTPWPRAQAPLLARRWSDRNFGIGADGLIALERGRDHAVAMAMWNADGSVGAMCGNGLRCLSVLAAAHGHVRTDEFVVETAAGPRRVRLWREADGAIRTVGADLGAVRVDATPRRLSIDGHGMECWCGDAGNPHAVVFVDSDLTTWPVAAIGAALQSHTDFPDGVNVEFVRAHADRLEQRTFERGSGETLACGTGAAVAALVAVRTGRLHGPRVRVQLRGGELTVHLEEARLVIEGPARTVFTGEIDA